VPTTTLRTKSNKDERAEAVEIMSIAELEELDMIAENCLQKPQEFVDIHSTATGKTTTIQRQQVYKLASVMARPKQIADVLGIDDEALLRNFPREIKMGHAFGKQKLISRFYHMAVYGNNPADRIFALKNWINMTDNGLSEALTEHEEGVEFVIRRPTKTFQNIQDIERIKDRYHNPDVEIEDCK